MVIQERERPGAGVRPAAKIINVQYAPGRDGPGDRQQAVLGAAEPRIQRTARPLSEAAVDDGQRAERTGAIACADGPAGVRDSADDRSRAGQRAAGECQRRVQGAVGLGQPRRLGQSLAEGRRAAGFDQNIPAVRVRAGDIQRRPILHLRRAGVGEGGSVDVQRLVRTSRVCVDGAVVCERSSLILRDSAEAGQAARAPQREACSAVVQLQAVRGRAEVDRAVLGHRTGQLSKGVGIRRHVNVAVDNAVGNEVVAAAGEDEQAAGSLVDGEVVDRAAVIGEDVVDGDRAGAVRLVAGERAALKGERAVAEEAVDSGALAERHGGGGRVDGVIARAGVAAADPVDGAGKPVGDRAVPVDGSGGRGGGVRGGNAQQGQKAKPEAGGAASGGLKSAFSTGARKLKYAKRKQVAWFGPI